MQLPRREIAWRLPEAFTLTPLCHRPSIHTHTFKQPIHSTQTAVVHGNASFSVQISASVLCAVLKCPIVRRRGAYDLSILDSMEDVFPPKRTTNNIYRDNRHQSESADLTETRDSLDRLAVSTSDRQRLSRSAEFVIFFPLASKTNKLQCSTRTTSAMYIYIYVCVICIGNCQPVDAF